jgi:hypothetical protein
MSAALSRARSLPAFLPLLYEVCGKFGMTLMLVGGSVVPQTRKYLAHANLSGTTGMPARRAPRG